MISIDLLSNKPNLVSAIGELRWKEWGHPPEPDSIESWIEITSEEAGTDRLPITWVAVDSNNRAVGAIGLGEYDIPERRDRSPWVVGTIVAAEQRSKGIGSQLINALEVWAKQNGYSQLWVATGGRAVDFYKKCGWKRIEHINRPSGEVVTVLSKVI